MQAVAAEVVDFPDAEAREAFEDTRAVRAAARGDRRAFERLYHRHCGRVYALYLRLAGHREAAEDCVQEAFVSAWHSLPRFEERRRFSTWLHRIAVNAVLARRRGLAARLETTTDDAGTLDRRSVGNVPPLDLEAAIAALPEGARHVLVLVGIYRFSREEASTHLGIAVGTSKAQLHRAPAPGRTARARCGGHMTNQSSTDVRGLDERLAALPRELAPARDLWPGIEARIAPRPAVRPRRWPYALAAGLAVAVLGALIGGRIARDRAPLAAAGETAETAETDSALAAARLKVSQDADYRATRAALEQTYRERLALLAPETRSQVERDLALIRAAHEDIRGSLARDPGSRVLTELLRSTTEQEFDLYNTVGRNTELCVPRTRT